jgi:hypothetical protein
MARLHKFFTSGAYCSICGLHVNDLVYISGHCPGPRKELPSEIVWTDYDLSILKMARIKP